MKQRHLETVVPPKGGKVIVVRGQEKGLTGKLLAKDKQAETALVQVRWEKQSDSCIREKRSPSPSGVPFSSG